MPCPTTLGMRATDGVTPNATTTATLDAIASTFHGVWQRGDPTELGGVTRWRSIRWSSGGVLSGSVYHPPSPGVFYRGRPRGYPQRGGPRGGVPGGVPGGALRGTCHREATRGGGLGAGQAPPPARGRKKCTFFLVFNNSPSRDRCLVRVFFRVFGGSGGSPGGMGGTPPGGALKSSICEGTRPTTMQSRVPSQAVPGGPRGVQNRAPPWPPGPPRISGGGFSGVPGGVRRGALPGGCPEGPQGGPLGGPISTPYGYPPNQPFRKSVYTPREIQQPPSDWAVERSVLRHRSSTMPNATRGCNARSETSKPS